MKVYIKSATNVADIQAKIAKKQAVIDKKIAWIEKKESAIQKKLALLEGQLTDEEYNSLVTYLNAVKTTRKRNIPDEISVNCWGLARNHGWDYEDKRGKALYSIDEDAESIYNSEEAIKEAQGIIDGYNQKLDAIKAKDSEIDEIPECMKEFMLGIIADWDEFDMRIRDESKPYYYDLKREANALLTNNDTRSRKEVEEFLEGLYPKVTGYSTWSAYWDRKERFETEHVEVPFKREFGISSSAAMKLWDKTDEQIHRDNEEAGKNLILDLLKRVTKITGAVTDWSRLRLTAGNGGRAVLNGTVIGEEGTAKVESIYASGPIQRLHIRTLVHEVKQ